MGNLINNKTKNNTKLLVKGLIYLFLILTGFVTKAQETYSISGTVTDKKGHPIPGAVVFIADTKKAMPTNGSGDFSFEGLLPGNYELLVKILGFNTEMQKFRIQDKPVKLAIKLTESNTLLKEVNITVVKPKISKRYQNWFTDNFIGTDANARQCYLLNPEVLNLTKPKGLYELVITADDFLIIENNALGYRIKYLLNKFIFHTDYGIAYYDGSAYFEELEGTKEQQAKWEENRKKAYLGSSRHFLRAAMNNRSRAEGFFTYALNDKRGPGNKAPLKAVDIDSVLKETGNNSKSLISIIHGAPRPDLYIYYIRSSDHQDALTWVKQCVDTVVIDKNGGTIPDGKEFFNGHYGVDRNRGLSPGVAFSFWGRWASPRVADLTPLDYFVDVNPDSTFIKPPAIANNSNKKTAIKQLQNILPFDTNSLEGSNQVYGIINRPASVPDSSKNKELPGIQTLPLPADSLKRKDQPASH